MEQRIIIGTGDKIFTFTKDHRLEMETYRPGINDNTNIDLWYKGEQDTPIWVGSEEECSFIMDRIMVNIVEQRNDSIITIFIPGIAKRFQSREGQ